jgi:hypothetical protein
MRHTITAALVALLVIPSAPVKAQQPLPLARRIAGLLAALALTASKSWQVIKPQFMGRSFSQRLMNPGRLIMALAMLPAFALSAHAQEVALRLGGGPALTGEIGVAGLVAAEFRIHAFILRGEGRVVTGKAERDATTVFYGGVALGIALSQPGTRPRPYVLLNVARGLDVAEGDMTTARGVTVGVDISSPLGLFSELRYEHSSQRQNPAPYYHLPRDQVTLLVGLRIGCF